MKIKVFAGYAINSCVRKPVRLGAWRLSETAWHNLRTKLDWNFEPHPDNWNLIVVEEVIEVENYDDAWEGWESWLLKK
jgi:hypothetical protein